MVVKYFKNCFGNENEKNQWAIKVIGNEGKDIDAYMEKMADITYAEKCEEQDERIGVTVEENYNNIFVNYAEIEKFVFENMLKRKNKSVFKSDNLIEEDNDLIVCEWYL